MHTNKKKLGRWLSMLLSAVMVVSLVTVPVTAAELPPVPAQASAQAPDYGPWNPPALPDWYTHTPSCHRLLTFHK